VRHALFDGALDTQIDLLEDLPGELLFQTDVMDYYRNNLWLAASGASERFHAAAAKLPALNDRGAESRVGEKAAVRGSWMASGVEVDGTVEGSVLFPGVVVRRGAVVSRSVVMGGNRIGAGTELTGALVCPFLTEPLRAGSNIGENCSLGVRSSTMRNADFPSQIRDGLTLIGSNAEIPNGFTAEGGTYIAPGTPATTLRRLKMLRRGASVLGADQASAPGHAHEAVG